MLIDKTHYQIWDSYSERESRSHDEHMRDARISRDRRDPEDRYTQIDEYDIFRESSLWEYERYESKEEKYPSLRRILKSDEVYPRKYEEDEGEKVEDTFLRELLEHRWSIRKTHLKSKILYSIGVTINSKNYKRFSYWGIMIHYTHDRWTYFSFTRLLLSK